MIIIPTEKYIDWNRTPIVLIALISLNILIFLFYQSGDKVKVERSIKEYIQHDYLDLEWSEYKTFLDEQEKVLLVKKHQALYEQKNYSQLAYWILSDAAFAHYFALKRNMLYPQVQYSYWRQRDQLHKEMLSVSSIAWGYQSSSRDWLQLITYQFLHADVLHLVGNMFILAVCGFAVEASIGHGLFLLFYLLAGVAGALFYGMINTHGSTLIGASGSISGVMAMYLGIFRLKRIEFFYWIFVFAGYFRAPALFILPVYVANELLNYVNQPDSNIAFMAHMGGFIVGAVLVLFVNKFTHPIIDQGYVEEDQSVPEIQQARSVIYHYLEKLHFGSALTEIDRFETRFGADFELSRLRVMINMQMGKQTTEDVHKLLCWPNVSPRQLSQIKTLWQANPSLLSVLSHDELARLGCRFLRTSSREESEAIYQYLKAHHVNSVDFTDLAKGLANIHAKLGNKSKSAEYQAVVKHHHQGNWL